MVIHEKGGSLCIVSEVVTVGRWGRGLRGACVPSRNALQFVIGAE